MDDIFGSQKNVENWFNSPSIPPNEDNLISVWGIYTPNGYLIRKIQGTRKQSEDYAKNHYIVYQIAETVYH